MLRDEVACANLARIKVSVVESPNVCCNRAKHQNCIRDEHIVVIHSLSPSREATTAYNALEKQGLDE